MTDMEMVLDKVKEERFEQIENGFDNKHDDESHGDGSIVFSAWGAIARLGAAVQLTPEHKNYEYLIVQSAALLVAELERIERRKTK